MADFIVADSGGKGNAVFLSGKGFGAINDAEQNAFTREMRRLCPDCKVKVIDIPIANWGSLTTKTPAIIRQDPDVDYLVPLFDGMALFMVPAVHAANAQDRVKIVSFNATPAVMQFLKKGDVIAADVGNATYWEGWGFADQALRILSGQRPVPNIVVPQRLFDKTNINSINLKAQESTWYSKANFKALYRAHWGVK